MKRIYICDPICAQGFGHNLSALHYFSHFLSKKFPEAEVVGLTSKYLPDSLEDAKTLKLHRVFHHYYQNSMPFKNYDEAQESLSFKTVVSSYNYQENLAYQDMEKLFTEFKWKAGDLVFFPSVDFYSAQAILRFFETQKPETLPLLNLRFIGVMENNSKYYTEPRCELFSMIRTLKAKAYKINISAETPKYADFISQRVDCDVSPLTYPMMADSLKLKSKSSSFKVLCPGAQRRDKGFTRLFNIISQVTLENPDAKFEFFIQTVPGVSFSAYQSQLYALPGVRLLPPTLTMEKIKSLYEESHMVLLPYDSDIYYLRGSAVLMEALAYGRLVITSDHTAFSEQVRYYNCGKICQSDQDFAKGIREFYDTSLLNMERQALQSRFRYGNDCEFSYRSWFQC